MGTSHRIRTEIGINKTINVELEQNFNFVEILSFKIQQEDVYTKSCADYGVIIGRVTANGGFGLPNARVSIFVPIEDIDRSNPEITSIYPYKTPEDKNDDGYRYNLLPYEPSYPTHAATGTFPSAEDVLTNKTAIEIYEKYYKYTVKTNESGDYMIMGAPLGTHIVFLDLDLSDIGEFSLTPQDLIRMGRATEAQVAGENFKESTDLNSLPQIVSLTKSVDISPLWGDPTTCQIAITRTDFDLRDDANIEIQPTAVFIGSVFSSPDKFRVRKRCKPKDNLGNLCDLVTAPGQILAIRQTINNDSYGNPVLEQYKLEQSGNIIDSSGTWMTELPMNLEYVVTNEFGESVITSNSSIGIPTKAKYRFKIKWSQPPTLTEQTRRGYFLVPNIKEYGWTTSTNDPTGLGNLNSVQQLSSYYFGLDWSGYTNGFVGTKKIDKLNEGINCEDTFYEFKYNRVYTVSGLIDEYKNGAKGRFIGIKEIDDDSCSSSTNKFPVNDGVRNFDFLFFIFSLLLVIIQPLSIAILYYGHILLFIYQIVIGFICMICGVRIPIIKVYPFRFICNILGIKCDERSYTIRLPMITYPDCDACDCPQESSVKQNSFSQQVAATGNLSYFSSSEYYQVKFDEYTTNLGDNGPFIAEVWASTIGGNSAQSRVGNSAYKLPHSAGTPLPSGAYVTTSSKTLTIGERINLFNQRQNYFNGLNKINVTFAKDYNNGVYHTDNTITVVATSQYEAGTLLTFVNPLTTNDRNYLYTANTGNEVVSGISGTSYNSSAATTINVSYAISQNANDIKTYNLPYGSDGDRYKYPQDREYYQVITAITMSQAYAIWNISYPPNSFPGIIDAKMYIDGFRTEGLLGGNFWMEFSPLTAEFKTKDFYEDFDNQYMLILQRGVDPYSPHYTNEYDLSMLFGYPLGRAGFTVTANTRVNIPIQKIPTSSPISVQSFNNQSDMFYQSYFFRPGAQYASYTSSGTGYYGSADISVENYGGVVGSKFLRSNRDNGYFNSFPASNQYSNNQDLSGLAYMQVRDYNPGLTVYNFVDNFAGYMQFNYITKTIAPSSLNISNKVLNVMRTDRLPSSDSLDGSAWGTQAALLQQNLKFAFYEIIDGGTDSIQGFTLGAEIATVDMEDLSGYTGSVDGVGVIDSVGSCENMVQLKCYQGFGSQFSINQDCVQDDAVERGCYLFMKRPLIDLFKDIKNIAEYFYRFRFFYGLCRGVLSQSFVNNWVNGTLYAFPIQVDTYYDGQNKPYSKYCSDLIYYDKSTTNFYYRSSPYNGSSNKFVGKRATRTNPVNDTNLLFPTTIINLGVKSSLYKNVSFDPSARAYTMKELDSTSYSDTSDLINLFVISRITDASFLGKLLSAGDNSLNQLFSRDGTGKRVDGDLAQLMSINSEVGVIKFSPEFYEVDPNLPVNENPTTILGNADDPIIAVWFSSTTENLQLKDFLSPGRINFRPLNNSTYATYPYGVKSQIVPFYQWGLNNTRTIFGDEKNNWKTDSVDIVQNLRYQSTDRTNRATPPATYFQSNTSPSIPSTDLYDRGYIFSVDGNGLFSQVGAASNKFIVGAPFHFYFGPVKGDSALDKFKTKYGIVE